MSSDTVIVLSRSQINFKESSRLADSAVRKQLSQSEYRLCDIACQGTTS